jgi:hypothetical protein
LKKSRNGWSAKLAHVIEIKGGPKLFTLHDARAFILKLPKHKHSSQWDAAIRDLLQAAESGTADDIKQATLAIELAFFYQGQLPMRVPAPTDEAHAAGKGQQGP